jgi:hypothetical protein
MRSIQSTLYPERSFVCDLVAARNSLSIILLSDVPQHCKKRQTNDVTVLNKAAQTRKIVTPSSKSFMARRVIVATMIETALMVTVSEANMSVSVQNS